MDDQSKAAFLRRQVVSLLEITAENPSRDDVWDNILRLERQAHLLFPLHSRMPRRRGPRKKH